MKCLKLYRWAAALALTIALAPTVVSAQDADTLSISGTFHMDELQEYQGTTVGADLAAVFARDNEHWWTLTLYGVTYSHDYFYWDYEDASGYGYDEEFVTSVHATSFDFEFFGPDADVLNEVVSQQLIRGDLLGDGFFTLNNVDYFDSTDPFSSGPYSVWQVGLLPLDRDVGVSFDAGGGGPFPTDENGYPVIEPQRLHAGRTSIFDRRPGNWGALASFYDIVDIGSSEPPLPPSLKILDASAPEGDKGTSRLALTVTLSRSNKDAVTVNYQTANGTALASNDYYAASGTVTFQPGQTSRTIAISIRTDRKREPNEAFSVQLSNAVGATINDAVGTATILNDD